MKPKKSKKRGWGLLHGTVEQDYADIKRWAAQFTDAEWEKMLVKADQGFRREIAVRRRRLIRSLKKVA
jgi:hypothetical protein